MIKWKAEGGALVVYLQGEIDHYASERIRDEMERLIRMNHVRILTLDFSDVTFMDSSGIGMLIGRYKTMTARGGQIVASGLSAPIARLFRMAGLHRIIPVVQQERREEA